MLTFWRVTSRRSFTATKELLVWHTARLEAACLSGLCEYLRLCSLAFLDIVALFSNELRLPPKLKTLWLGF